MKRRRVRKHVAIGELPRLGIAVTESRDPVVEEAAAGLQQAREPLGVESIWLFPTCSTMPMLAIASKDSSLKFAVVHDADLDPIAEARILDAPARKRRLRLGQRDTHDLDAVSARGVNREAPPATADVEDAFAGHEAELAADQLELRLLRLFQSVVAPREKIAQL